MKTKLNIAIYALAAIAAVQILLMGLLAMTLNNWVIGMLCGVSIPEVIHWLREQRGGDI